MIVINCEKLPSIQPEPSEGRIPDASLRTEQRDEQKWRAIEDSVRQKCLQKFSYLCNIREQRTPGVCRDSEQLCALLCG